MLLLQYKRNDIDALLKQRKLFLYEHLHLYKDKGVPPEIVHEDHKNLGDEQFEIESAGTSGASTAHTSEDSTNTMEEISLSGPHFSFRTNKHDYNS